MQANARKVQVVALVAAAAQCSQVQRVSKKKTSPLVNELYWVNKL